MPIIKASGKWGKVEIPEALKEGESEFQFLDSFEELPSYKTVKDSQVKKEKKSVQSEKKPEPKSIKRKAKQLESDEIATGKLSKLPSAKKAKRPKVLEESVKEEEEMEVEKSESSASLWTEYLVAEPVRKALGELGFAEPTPIQKLVLPSAIRDRLDIVGAAETGSGKTLAFGIPIVTRLLEIKEEGGEIADTEKTPLALILTPTRELAIQIRDHIKAILKHTDFGIASIVGGLSIQKQRRLLKFKPEIIVATPGRLWELLQESDSGYLSGLTRIRFLVIDETDRMVEKGHFEELQFIMEHLNQNEECNQLRQTFVFSATLSFVHPTPNRLYQKGEVEKITQKQKIDALVTLVGLRKKHKIFDITQKFGTAELLQEARVNCCDLADKDAKLCYFLRNFPGRTLIFTNSIDCVRRLNSLLRKLKLVPLMLHAKMQQKQRLKNLERFAEGANSILLATDVAARGLDIKCIQNVVHYQVPRTAEIYVHRSGRTARATSEGLAVMFVDPTDSNFYHRICVNLNKEKDLPEFPMDERKLAKFSEIVAVASELDSLEHRVNRTNSNANWLKRTAAEMEIELDEEDMLKSFGRSLDPGVTPEQKRLKQLTKQLQHLLSQPLKGHSQQITKYPTQAIIAQYEAKKVSQVDSALTAFKKETITTKAKLNIHGRLKLKKTRKASKKLLR